MASKRPIDVRIIVEGASDVEGVSKAMSGISLGADYHITISSIIPTTSLDIAEKAVQGADIVLIATDVDAPGRELAERYQKALKGKVGHVERMKFPYGHDVEYINPKLIQEEIKNAIIRAGLGSVKNIKELHESKQNLIQVKEEFANLYSQNNALSSEYENNLDELKQSEERIKILEDKLSSLNENIDEIKTDYSNLKSQFLSKEGKKLFEIFSIEDLWIEIFNEDDFNEEKIIFVTEKFRPVGIIIGQGLIGANNKEDAIDWLKIIKTSLIFFEKNSEELKNGLTAIDNSFSEINKNNYYDNSSNDLKHNNSNELEYTDDMNFDENQNIRKNHYGNNYQRKDEFDYPVNDNYSINENLTKTSKKKEDKKDEDENIFPNFF